MRRIPTFPVVLALSLSGVLGFLVWKSLPADDLKGKTVRLEEPRATPSARASGDPVSTAFTLLDRNPAPPDSLRSLRELRSSLVGLPEEEAVAAIRGFLNRGEDRATGLSFEITGDGSLSEWPSFRTFLLDVLLEIDPAAAAASGREVLAKPTTADEWALALRNVARGEASEDAAFLRAKTEELIANPAWQADPSIGYLNAFDILVHLEATATTPLLSSLIRRKDRKDLAHAGFLTLDRLVQRQPVEVLSRLSADSALQQNRPEMVAQQFARADLRDPAQRDLVRKWLLDPGRTAVELRSFAGVYPNNNRFVSNNLLTTEAGDSGGDLAGHDREALEIIVAWTADPAFTAVRDHLGAMVSRLNGFVGARDRNSVSPPPE